MTKYSYKKHICTAHHSTAGTSSDIPLNVSNDSTGKLSLQLEHARDSSEKKRMKFCDFEENNSIVQGVLVEDPKVEICDTAAHTFPATQADVEGHNDCDSNLEIPIRIHFLNDSNSSQNPVHYSEAVDTSLEDFRTEHSMMTAKLVTSLYANSNLPRSTAHNILKSLQEFLESSIEPLKKKCLSVESADSDNLGYIFDIVKNSFSEFKTEHVTMKKLEKAGYFIPPMSIPITGKLKPRRKRGEKKLVVVNSTIEFIPLKPVLKKFLEEPNVFASITKFINSKQNKIQVSSMLEGEVWQSILQYFPNKLVLPLTIFFDDYEINNPLGSHRGKAKMGGVYYTLSCIPYQFASKQKNIFLAQIHKSTDHTEFGNRKIFTHLINELNDLATNGININVNNEKKKVYFAVGRILGDNLGLNTILGFVTSFNSSYCCRICTATKECMEKLIIEDETILRTPEQYAKDVDECAHGVIEECIFNELPYFHVDNNISVDPMHDLFEGICRYEFGEILHYMIMKKKYFSREILNDRISLLNVDSATGINIPPEIKKTAIDKKFLILSAAEMSFLVDYF